MICKLFRREDMDCKMTDIIAIISSIIAIGFNFIMTLIIGISGVYILLLYLF